MEIDQGDEAYGDDDFEDEGDISMDTDICPASNSGGGSSGGSGSSGNGLRGMGGGLSLAVPTLQRGESFELTDATFRNARGDEVASDRVVRSKGLNPDDLQVVELLGRGAGSSVVERGIDRRTGRNYALKVVNVFDPAQRAQMVREIDMHRKHDCPCLVRYYGAFVRQGQVRIALEFMDGGSLDKVVARSSGCVPEAVLAAIAYQMLWGLAYLRYEKQFHRDIKPPNVLVNRDGEVKLTDFGISRSFEDSMSMAQTLVGTIMYMSPERIRNEKYNFKADIWSLGVLIIELATGSTPFAAVGASHLKLALAITEGPGPTLPADGGFSRELRDFVAQCVHKDPEQRCGPDALLAAPWFAKALGEEFAPGGDVHVAGCCRVVARWVEAGRRAAAEGGGGSSSHK